MRCLVVISLAFFLNLNFLLAQVPSAPKPQRLVNDFSKLLQPNQVQGLEQWLLAYEDSTSNQFTVVILPTTNGDEINLFTAELGEKWKVGRKGKDNGAVLLVAVEDRQLAIQVGYGLEGALNDATIKLIIENVIVPEFRKGEYPNGIQLGLAAMMQAAAGEFSGTGTKKDLEPAAGLPGILGLVLFIFVIYMINKRRGGGGPGGGIFMPPGPGGFGRHISYGGGGGGFGGGGFGGFGGGSFGGGGASGSW